MIAHKWKPLDPIEPESEGYDFSEIDSLHLQWQDLRQEREKSIPNAYRSFLDRLRRSWAIETGILEGLYDLDRGVTETLVEKGIVAEYIDRSATDKEPDELVKILKDHQDAIEFVYQQIKMNRPMSRYFMMQLHLVLTQNQLTYQAVDQFGHMFQATLDRGTVKKLPNNPTRPDGTIHEYCPPLQVDSELDQLVNLYTEFEAQMGEFHPLLVGAWLHHRFTQIHPFQDGNGRVARALLTWHLVNHGYLPIVIFRDDRAKYIQSLEAADTGDLTPFVDLIVESEKRTIIEAVGEPEPVADSGLVNQVLDHIVNQVKRQNLDKESQMRRVSKVAQNIRDTVEESLSKQGTEITDRLSGAGLPLRHFVDTGGPGDHEYWYQAQVIETGKMAQHWVNLNEPRYFVKLSLSPDEPSRNPRLVFVISMHHIGKQLTGIMAATAFSQIEYHAEADAEQSEGTGLPYFRNCSVTPFTFTWNDDATVISPRIIKWTEECLSIALRYWTEFFR